MNNIPKEIGPYRVEEEIGRGGMSVVYRAVDSRNHRQVALKVLPPEFAHNPMFLNRFVKEGESAVKLRHANIMHTIEADKAGGYHYIAMELAVEGTLADRMKATNGLLPEQVILDVLRQSATGLDHAHSLGLLHRDIKPSNIMFAGEGRVVIADFGVAKDLLSEHTQVTMPGFSVGTPAYMSPEQARGDLDLDRRADIYSLGVVAYALLTGKMPFDAPSQLVLLRKIVDESPRPPEEVNPNIHPGAAYVLKHVLAKDPTTRYQSAKEFVNQLQHALQQPRWDTGAGNDATIAMIPIPGGGPPRFSPDKSAKPTRPKTYQPSQARRPTPPPPYYAPSAPPIYQTDGGKSASKSNRLPVILGSVAGLVIVSGILLFFFFPNLMPSLSGPMIGASTPVVKVTETANTKSNTEITAAPSDPAPTEVVSVPIGKEESTLPVVGESTVSNGDSSGADSVLGGKPVVQLISPDDQITLADVVAEFGWQVGDRLNENEALELLVWPEDAGKDGWMNAVVPAGLRRTQEDSQQWNAQVDLLALDRVQGSAFDPGTYFWGVAVVDVPSNERLGLASDIRIFSYAPPSTTAGAGIVVNGCEGVLCDDR